MPGDELPRVMMTPELLTEVLALATPFTPHAKAFE